MDGTKVVFEELNTPVRDACDVLVAGGGTAGVVAAIAAARQGAKTILIERGNFLGGTLLGGGIKWMSFFNAYLAHNVEKKQCVGGVGQYLVDRMVKEGYSPGHVEEEINFGHESVGTVVDRELLIKALLEIMDEEGVRVYLNTAVVAAVREGKRLDGVIIESKSGREALLAKCVVDCTGDGDVAAFAGESYESMPSRLGVGLMFGMANVDLNKAVEYARNTGILSHLGTGDKGSETDRVIWAAIDLYKDPAFADFMARYGFWGPYIASTHENEATYINGITTSVVVPNSANPGADSPAEAAIPFSNLDGLDAKATSDAQRFLRDKTLEWAALMKRHLPGFENAYINWSAPDLGVRSTRCVACEYDITGDDVRECAMFDDRIGVFGGNDSDYYNSVIGGGGWFAVPYRAIVPKHIDNLLVAGRMISAGFVANMSTRLVGCCFIQGEGAGTAAALCAAKNCIPRALDVSVLQGALRNAGAILD